MRSSIVILCLAALLVASACSREEPAVGSATSGGDPEINQWLLARLEDHGLHGRIDGGWVALADSPVRFNGALVSDSSKADSAIIQLEMRALLPDGRELSQSVVGFGKDRADAVAQAQASYLLGTFHALLAAFVLPSEGHVEVERRTLAGRERVITHGGVVMKTLKDGHVSDDGHWREQLLREVDALALPPGTHWIDVYHAYIQDQEELQIELDSRRWPEMEARMRTAAWPRAGLFTSVRQILIVQDPDAATGPATRPAAPASAPAGRSGPAVSGSLDPIEPPAGV